MSAQAATLRSEEPARQRLAWAIVFLLTMLTLYVAFRLTPDARGFGTHEQLGLPPCGVLLFTGLPCPGCGMTTSFSAMMHLDVVAAAKANPFGIPLAITTMLMMPLSLVAFVRGWDTLAVFDRMRFDRWGLLLLGAGIFSWIGRMIAAW